MNAATWLASFPAPDRWRELALARGPRLATAVLALLLAVQAALLVTDLTGGTAHHAGTAADTAAASRQVPAAHRIDIAAITNAHLFGVKQAPSVSAANAPQTSMPLVLTGIIAGDDPSTGLAIIGETATATRVYAVGSSLPGGARLHSVYGDRVLLDRNGSIEALTLPHQFANTAGVAAPAPAPAAEAPPAERVRRLIAEQPAAITDIMRPQPVFAQGKQRGYRVYPGRNRQAFVRLGLRPGDLVTAINGTPLDDPGRGQEIFQTLSSASEAHVTVMRNGRQQDLSLNLATVANQADQLANGGSEGAADGTMQVPEPAPNPANNSD